MLLLATTMNAKKVCKSDCVKKIGASSFSYNYAWYIEDNAICTSVPWKGTKCGYAIYMNGNLIDSGTCDGGDAVTC